MREITFLKLLSVNETRQKVYNQLGFFSRGKRITANGTNSEVLDGKAFYFLSKTILHNNSIFTFPLPSMQSLLTVKRCNHCTDNTF